MATWTDIQTWFPSKAPEDAWIIEDADEEIFLLYSRLQASASATVGEDNLELGGLGFVDSRKEELSVQISARAPSCEPVGLSGPLSPKRLSRRGQAKQGKIKAEGDETLDIRLFQDTTALRSRKGDTGSVLWRASVHLARLLLLQQRCPPEHSFLPLHSCRILELGSGTGLLSIVMAPFVEHYTATDLPSLVPLIRKNQAHNISPSDIAKVTADDLDWVQLHNTRASLRPTLFPIRSPAVRSSSQSAPRKHARKKAPTPAKESVAERPERPPIDLILAVDCIYNPSLIAPLLSTIDHFAGSGSNSAAVLVVLELRADDVTREFLESWLTLSGKWKVWSVPLLGTRFAMWVGKRITATTG